MWFLGLSKNSYQDFNLFAKKTEILKNQNNPFR